jgi:hypothetical protein
MRPDDDKLSTSALARKLNVPVQQLFTILKDFGWIHHTGDSWALTPKGEFEGGSYHSSRRYGSYIVWPEKLDQHPLLLAIESNQRITAATMCQYFPRLHTRQVNRALAELGLQHHSLLGWELTRLGRAWGGLQEDSSASGSYYVTWPQDIIDNPVVRRELSLQCDQMRTQSTAENPEPDLFVNPSAPDNSCLGVDGHKLRSTLQTNVCNWLYFAQLAHAIRRALPIEELVYADFYVPIGNIFVDCWEEDIPAGELSGKFYKRELYKSLELRHLEIDANDSNNLDEVLGRGLLSFGVRC